MEPHISLCSSSSSLVFSPSPTGTNSTNAVGGSGGLSQSQGGSQCLSAPQQRKGTFTDDLHKLVDNWARDAMNLSQVVGGSQLFQHGLTSCSSRVQMLQFCRFHQGKRSAKQLQQAPAQGHSYEVSSNQNQISFIVIPTGSPNEIVWAFSP